MIYTRFGKCATCQQPTKERRDFAVTLDMLDPDSPPVLTGELLQQLSEWRAEEIFCPAHSEGDNNGL